MAFWDKGSVKTDRPLSSGSDSRWIPPSLEDMVTRRPNLKERNFSPRGTFLAWATRDVRRMFQHGINSFPGLETLLIFTIRGINTGLMFLVNVMLARFLGVNGYGIYSYAYSLMALLALPAHAGLPDLLSRETARGIAQERPDLVKGVWQWAGRAVAIFSTISVGIGGPLLITWQGGLGSAAGQTMAFALLLVPLIALGNLRGAALRGLQKVVLGHLPEFALRPWLFLLLVGGTILLWPELLSPPVAMMLHAIASLLAFVVGAWLLWKHTPESVRRAPSSMNPCGWLQSGVFFAGLIGLGVVNQQTSTIILGLFATLDDVGRYRVAAQVATLAAFGLNSINAVIAPLLTDLWVRRERAHLQRLVTLSAQTMLVVSLLVGLMFVLIGRSFFRFVFGPEFDGCYVPLLILLLGHVMDAALGPAGTLLNMTGHEADTIMGMTWATFFNITLSMVMVPLAGIIGAAIATALSVIAWKILFWWYARKRLGINSSALLLTRG